MHMVARVDKHGRTRDFLNLNWVYHRDGPVPSKWTTNPTSRWAGEKDAAEEHILGLKNDKGIKAGWSLRVVLLFPPEA